MITTYCTRILSLDTPIKHPVLLRTASIAAFASAVVFRRNLDAEFSLLYAFGILPDRIVIPESIQDWFILYLHRPLIGLLYMNFFDLINMALVVVFFTALLILLFRKDKLKVTLAALFTYSGFIGYLFTNQSVNLLFLSRRYFETAIPDRYSLLLTGERSLQPHILNSFQSPGLYPSFLLISTAGLLLSIVMLNSKVFGRSTGVFGIIANCLGLAYYPVLYIEPDVVFVPLSISAVFLLIWYLKIAIRLWRLSCPQTEKAR